MSSRNVYASAMARFTLRETWGDLMGMCVPAKKTARKEEIFEDMKRQKMYNELQLRDIESRAETQRLDARAKLMAGDKMAARKILLDRRGTTARIRQHEFCIQTLEDSMTIIEDKTNFYEVVELVTEAQRQFNPKSNIVVNMDNIIDGLRDMQENTRELRMAMEGNTNLDVDDSELEREIEELMNETREPVKKLKHAIDVAPIAEGIPARPALQMQPIIETTVVNAQPFEQNGDNMRKRGGGPEPEALIHI